MESIYVHKSLKEAEQLERVFRILGFIGTGMVYENRDVMLNLINHCV